MNKDNIFSGFGKNSRNFVFGIGIFLLVIFVVVYGINVFYPKPEYDDFCGKELYLKTTIDDCTSAGGVWNDIEYEQKELAAPVIDGRCQAPPSCYEEYDSLLEKRSKSIFFIAIPLGILIIALGAFVFHLNSVGIGLMLGGIGTLIYGAGGYWRYSDNLFKFIISFIGLVVLIFFSYWFEKKSRG